MPYIPKEQQEREKKEAGRQRDRRRRVLHLVLLAVFSGLTLYGMIRLGEYGLDLIHSKKTSEELREVWQETPEVSAETAGENPTVFPETALPEPTPAETAREEPTAAAALPTTANETETNPSATAEPAAAFGNRYPDNPKLSVSARFQKLRKKSGYIMGWLKMEGVDEAIVQKDNSFFLNHDAMGNRNVNGAIFLDAGISLLDRPPCLLLYGHNMKTGAMFGNLKKFEQAGYAYQHRMIQCDTLYEEGTFVVFAVSRISIVRGTARYTDLYALTSPDAPVRKAALDSLISTDQSGSVVDVSEEDQLVLLITCTADDNERLVVAARRLRSQETEERITIRGQDL